MKKLVSKGVSKLREHGLRQFLRQSYPYIHKRSNSKRINKTKQRRSRYTYTSDPDITVIVQFFNSKPNIPQLIDALRHEAVDELIVIDDGSVDGSAEAWIDELDRPNEFLLRAHDIYEVRTYDRALRMANGDLICLTQDDDIPPRTSDWINDAKALFREDEKLLILGGFNGLNIKPRNPEDGEVHSYEVGKSPTHTHPDVLTPFEYVMAVNRPPMWVRRDEFLKQGGVDQEFAPFQCDDTDACLRTWQNGFRVGLYESGFERDIDAGGMYHFNEVGRQARENWNTIYDRYGDLIECGWFEEQVKEANYKLDKQDPHHTQ